MKTGCLASLASRSWRAVPSGRYAAGGKGIRLVAGGALAICLAHSAIAQIGVESQVGQVMGADAPSVDVEFADTKLDYYVRSLVGKHRPAALIPADVTEITDIDLSGMQLTSLHGIEALKSLHAISAVSNRIVEIDALAKLRSLQRANLSFNMIANVGPLRNLDALTVVNLDHNRIKDVSPLADNDGLGAGDRVSLAGNPLECEQTGPNLDALKARGVEVISPCE